MTNDDTLTPEQQAAQRKNLRAKAQPYNGSYRYDDDDETPTPNSAPHDDGGNRSDEGRVEDGNEPSDPEEKSFKKRYGDLRRSQAKERTDNQRKVDDLSKEISKLQKGSGETLPRTEEEIRTWMGDHPDLASMVLFLADKAAGERTQNIEVEIERVREDQLAVARDRAYLELKKLHPDVDDIRADSGFHEWVAEQPDEIQAWFYDNETNTILAAKGINMYKVEKGIGGKKPKKASAEDHSQIVTQPRASGDINLDPHRGKRVWKESDVARLSQREFESNEEDIDLAINENRFVYDVTQATA